MTAGSRSRNPHGHDLRWGSARKDSFFRVGGTYFRTASAIYFTATTAVISLHEILITIFLFITAPVSAHILSKTALLKDFDYVGDQDDPLEQPLNVHTDQELEVGISEELLVDTDEPDDDG